MSKILAALVASFFAVTTFAAGPAAAGNDTGTAASTPTPAAAKPAKKAKKAKKAKAANMPANDAVSK